VIAPSASVERERREADEELEEFRVRLEALESLCCARLRIVDEAGNSKASGSEEDPAACARLPSSSSNN